MFDNVPAPNNLPVEPEIKVPPRPPMPEGKPTSPPAPVARMRGGIVPPMQHEPEDILAGVSSEASPSPESVGPSAFDDGASKQNKTLRVVMFVLIGVVILLVLVIGGLYVYRTYFNKPSTEQAQTSDIPSAPQAGAVNQQPTTPQPSVTPTVENPPVVSPTPTPDIPKPEPVGASSTSMIDSDHDGLSDAREAELKTDPNNADTDGDGLSDGDEVQIGTDPLVADTDGDGLSDGDEVHVWKTDPKNKDTDGDGYSDGQEVRGGYNPLGAGKLPAVR